MVCFADCYESCTRGGIVGVLVWVVEFGECEELALDIRWGRSLRYLKNLIVIHNTVIGPEDPR